MILSFAKTTMDPRYSHLFFVLDYEREKRNKHHSPHGHILFKNTRGASFSIDPPFNIIAGSSKPKVKELTLKFLNANYKYLHYAWDLFSQQNTYLQEYSDPSVKAACREWVSNNFMGNVTRLN